MTALRFQTWGRHQTSPVSLREASANDYGHDDDNHDNDDDCGDDYDDDNE